jgi:hypothetical protein
VTEPAAGATATDPAGREEVARPYLPVAVLIAAAAVAAGTGSFTWLTVRIEPTGAMTVLHDTLSGASANPAGIAFALVALVAPLVFLAAGRRVRQVAAVLAVLAGVGVAVTAARVAVSPASTARHSATLAGTQVTSVGSSAWPEVQAVAGLLIAGASVVVLRRAAGWRTMSRRYDAPSRRPPLDDWESLERGVDPTSDR